MASTRKGLPLPFPFHGPLRDCTTTSAAPALSMRMFSIVAHVRVRTRSSIGDDEDARAVVERNRELLRRLHAGSSLNLLVLPRSASYSSHGWCPRMPSVNPWPDQHSGGRDRDRRFPRLDRLHQEGRDYAGRQRLPQFAARTGSVTSPESTFVRPKAFISNRILVPAPRPPARTSRRRSTPEAGCWDGRCCSQ